MADEPNLGVLLFVAYRALEQRAYDAAVAAGASELTIAQARLLARIGPEGTRLTELAAQAQVTKQSAGHLVDELERAGYVERTPDPTDGRARLVRLTEQARAVAPAADAAVAGALAEWRTHLGERRMADLEETMRLLREITDPWA